MERGGVERGGMERDAGAVSSGDADVVVDHPRKRPTAAEVRRPETSETDEEGCGDQPGEGVGGRDSEDQEEVSEDEEDEVEAIVDHRKGRVGVDALGFFASLDAGTCRVAVVATKRRLLYSALRCAA